MTNKDEWRQDDYPGTLVCYSSTHAIHVTAGKLHNAALLPRRAQVLNLHARRNAEKHAQRAIASFAASVC